MSSIDGNMKSFRDKAVDLLKAICAFLVVCIHFPFPGEIGEYFTSITRIAVPIFFMISGYFFNPSNINRHITKIFMLALSANLIYMLLDLLAGNLEVSLQAIVKLVLLNESPFASHLWYLSALLYVLVIVKFFEMWRLKKVLYYFTPFLLLGDLIFGKYSLLIWGRDIPFVLVRNFAFVGVPYYSIGMLIREKRVYIGRWGIPFFIFTTLLERFVLVKIELNASRDHYFSTTFLAVAVLCYVLDYCGEINKCIAKIGRCYSIGIYIIHPMIGKCIEIIVARYGTYCLKSYYFWAAPIIIYCVSILVVFLFCTLGTSVRNIRPLT